MPRQQTRDRETVIRRDPKSGCVPAYNGRAWAYFKLGKAAQGLPDVEKALELEPNNPNMLDTRSHIFEALVWREEAIADYRRALPRPSVLPRHVSKRCELPVGMAAVENGPDSPITARAPRKRPELTATVLAGKLFRRRCHPRQTAL
jgi:tetratricopeptide (TPR) repeat protein